MPITITCGENDVFHGRISCREWPGGQVYYLCEKDRSWDCRTGIEILRDNLDHPIRKARRRKRFPCQGKITCGKVDNPLAVDRGCPVTLFDRCTGTKIL